MRGFIFCLLTFGAGTALAQEVTICYNYSCATEAAISFDGEDLVRINLLFSQATDAPTERESIRLAVGLMSQIAGAQSPIRYDKGGNDNEENVIGRMDCIDHARTTTAYLQFIQARGWLQFHRLLEPAHRAPLWVNDHWSARIEETASGAQYAVDTWFLDHGQPPSIFPMREWLKGAAPHG